MSKKCGNARPICLVVPRNKGLMKKTCEDGDYQITTRFDRMIDTLTTENPEPKGAKGYCYAQGTAFIEITSDVIHKLNSIPQVSDTQNSVLRLLTRFDS